MASRLDFSQIRSLYVGTSSSTQVDTNNLIVAGNVGIGMTAPTEKLVVAGAIRSTNQSNNFGTGGVSAFMDIINGSKLVRIGSVTGGDTLAGSEGDVGIFTRGNEVVRITSAYNVGIGTTAPTYKLDVVGEGRTSDAFMAGGAINIDNNLAIQISSAGAGTQRWIGINKNNGYGLIIGYVENAAALSGVGAYIRQVTSDPIHFLVNNATTAMSIVSSGNVGIGTTSPYNALTINRDTSAGTVSSIPGIAFKNRNNTNSIFVHSGIFADTYRDVADPHYSGGIWFTRNPEVSNLSSSSDIVFGTGFNVGTGLLPSERMRITSSGNVGIGTTAPQVKTHICTATDISLAYDENQYGLWVSQTSTSKSLILGYSNTFNAGIINAVHSGVAWKNILIATNGGNVGIGTTSPGDKLHVNAGGTGGIRIQADSEPSLYLNTTDGAANATLFNSYGNVGLVGYATSTNYIMYHYGGGGTLANQYTYFQTAGAERMRINGAGNVGIGTTAPYSGTGVTSLDINATSYPTLALSVGGSFVGGLFGFSDHVTMYAGTSKYISFEPGNSEKMRITAGGNVLIGTTTDAGYKLDVNGTIRAGVAGNSSANIPALLVTSSGTGDAQAAIAIQQATSEGDTIIFADYEPYVEWGISTENAANKIQFTAGTSTGSLGSKTLYNNAGNARTAYIKFDHDLASGQTLIGGNVGIGTTSPAGKLDIVGGQYNTGLIVRSSNTNGTGVAILNSDTGGHNWYLISTATSNGGGAGNLGFYDDTNGNYLMYIKGSNGNVGIGTTSPGEKLHVDGNAVLTYNNSYQGINSVGNKAILARVSPTAGIINYAEYATATNLNGFVMGSDDARVKGNIATDSLEFITNGSTRMTVLSSGYVGVNTTTPGTNFHVVGDVLIQTGALGVGVNPNATDGRIDASNDIVAYSSSDRRLKENITPIANALDKVKSLTGVEFDWKPEHKKAHGYDGHDTGVIAQEVQEVMPTAVRTNDTGYLAVRYEKLIGLLIEANKELAARVEELENKLK